MRRLRVHRVLSPVTGGALAFFLLQAGCGTGTAPGEDDGDDADDTSADDNPDDGQQDQVGDDLGDDPVGAAVWVKGSLAPNYNLPSSQQQNLFEIPKVVVQNVAPAVLTADQFACAGVGITHDQELNQIQQQIQSERNESGNTAPVTVIPANDDDLAQTMAWRPNPTDIDCIEVDGDRKCIVPLGGDTSTPGNKVAIVVGSGADQVVTEEINVGIRPIHTTCHPDGVCFVANLYSNYISVIDMVAETPLFRDGQPLLIPVDYYTSDITIAEKQPGGDFDDDFYLFAANQWLGSVGRYELQVVRGGLDASVDDVLRVNPAPAGQPESLPDLVFTGVGTSPDRLRLSEQLNQIYVANTLGGEIAILTANSTTGTPAGYTGVGAPAVDIIEVVNNVFVATTTPDRGLYAQNEQTPNEFNQPPTTQMGLNGSQVEIHQGALFDRTKAYNFEDAHNSVVALNPNLNERNVFQQTIFTDLNSAEANFGDNQKQITATLPGAMERLGNTLFMVGEGNDVVQSLDVNGQLNSSLNDLAGQDFQTGIRPTAMFVDALRDELVVVTWGAGLVETFDVNAQGAPINQLALRGSGDNLNGAIDGDEYPCSDLEVGEYTYFNTEFSNNGFKSCVTCHRKDNLSDGGSWSNGVTAPTTYHKIIPSWNQTETSNFFWNGSFDNDSYLSLAFAAQTRTNCELVLFGLTEGPDTPAAQRVGDLGNNGQGGNIVTGNDAICRPLVIDVGGTDLPVNIEDEIVPEINNQKALADTLISQIVSQNVNKNLLAGRPFTRVEVSRNMDWWMVSNDRVPPNPLAYLNDAGEAGTQAQDWIAQGEDIFNQAGCSNCHDPANGAFTDNKLHGRGAEYFDRFIERYLDSGLVDFDIAVAMLDANQNLNGSQAEAGEEVNLQLQMDTFMPFGFDEENILFFEDPLAEQPASQAELDTLLRQRIVNLEDPERGTPVGSTEGQVAVNTPSLRGVWWNPNFLHHGLAKTFREAVSGPGHTQLRTEAFLMNGSHPDMNGGERGWAVNITGSFNAHGMTSELSDEQLTALEYYIMSIP